jgi:hypothetical protein
MESEVEHARSSFDVKKSIKIIQNAAKDTNTVQRVITLRSDIPIDQTRGAHVVAYEWIQTKGMRYSGYQSQSRLQNQIVIVALSNGEVILKAPFEPHPSILLTYQTNMGTIFDVVAPPSANLEDSSFFAALNEEGKLKIFNYTIIDNS